MLKKLIKHDLKYGVRMFAVLHIILIIGCLMARFLVIDHLDFSADPEEFAPVIALLIACSQCCFLRFPLDAVSCTPSGFIRTYLQMKDTSPGRFRRHR